MKKIFLSILSILILMFSCTTAFAFEIKNNFIINGDFEDSSLESIWGGVIIDSGSAYKGYSGAYVYNPFGEIILNKVSHVMEYSDTVSLVGGTIYEISGYILNPISDNISSPRAKVSLGLGTHTITTQVSNAGCDWAPFSCSFIVSESGEYNLNFILESGDEYVGFFVDNISLIEKDVSPSSLALAGPTSVHIPSFDSVSYVYTPTFYDINDNGIDILSKNSYIVAKDLPSGVSFDSETYALTVSSNAKAGESFTLECLPPEGFNVPECNLIVTLTDNMIVNPSFEDLPSLNSWLFSSEASLVYDNDGYAAKLYTDNVGEYGCYTSIMPSDSLFLFENELYVLRAKVRSDYFYPTSNIYAKNTAISTEGKITFNIVDIGGGEWTDVVAAFSPSTSGIYDLCINLCAQSERSIYIDDISLTIEPQTASYLTVHAPGNIAISNTILNLPYSVLVRNQLGEVMEDEEVEVFLYPESNGISIDEENKNIIIDPSAIPNEYTIRAVSASNPNIEGEYTFTVSFDYIGDGGFEEKAANVWWTAPSPGQFSIVSIDNNKKGFIYCDDAYCLAFNNSYMKLYKDKVYRFSANIEGYSDDFPVIITAFINNAFDGEDIPVAQISTLDDQENYVGEFFSPEEDIVGRLMLYFESAVDAPIAALIDDISISEAIVMAVDVSIQGNAYVGRKVNGFYTYVNTVIDDISYNMSHTRWYIGNTPSGPFEPIGAPDQKELKLTEEMIGQYILFEVTPVCGATGLSGETVRSSPILVRSDNDDGEVIPDGSENQPQEPSIPQANTLKPISLPTSAPDTAFLDVHGHWAEKEISIMTYAGIANGRSNTFFDVNGNITRAEFSAFLARAFSLIPVHYDGQFDDVSSSDWFAGYIQAIVNAKISVGISDNLFAPNDLITREQMAVMIMRAYYSVGGEAPLSFDPMFYDMLEISDWAYDDVKAAYNSGIILGTDYHTFAPKRSALRCEALVMIKRMLDILE